MTCFEKRNFRKMITRDYKHPNTTGVMLSIQTCNNEAIDLFRQPKAASLLIRIIHRVFISQCAAVLIRRSVPFLSLSLLNLFAMSIINDQLEIKYVPDFYSGSVADEYCRKLLENVPFESLTFNFADKTFTPNRKVAAFGDDGLTYSFSGITVSAKPWTPLIEKIKADVEQHMGVVYNFCFLNLYPDGSAKISPHQGNEFSLDAQVPIACVSLGATRQMIFTRGKDYSTSILDLENGILMSMHSPTNLYWKHVIPAQPGVTTERISLTFRALSSANPKRRFAAVESPPPTQRKRFTPVQEDPSNKVLLEKQIGIGCGS